MLYTAVIAVIFHVFMVADICARDYFLMSKFEPSVRHKGRREHVIGPAPRVRLEPAQRGQLMFPDTHVPEHVLS